MAKQKIVDDYLAPHPRDISEKENDVLANVYAENRKKGYNKERAAKIAWGAVNNMRKAEELEKVEKVLPSPKGEEKEQEFISRCMGNPTMNSEFPDQKQRSAVCYAQYRKVKKSMLRSEIVEKTIQVIKNIMIKKRNRCNR